MDSVLKYFEEKKYQVIDNTLTFDKKTVYQIFPKLRNDSKLIIMYKQTERTKDLFTLLLPHTTADYVFFNKDNYMVLSTDDLELYKKLIDDFLNNNLSCIFCHKESILSSNCNKCHSVMCGVCVGKKNINGIITCLNCGEQNKTS